MFWREGESLHREFAIVSATPIALNLAERNWPAVKCDIKFAMNGPLEYMKRHYMYHRVTVAKCAVSQPARFRGRL